MFDTAPTHTRTNSSSSNGPDHHEFLVGFTTTAAASALVCSSAPLPLSPSQISAAAPPHQLQQQQTTQQLQQQGSASPGPRPMPPMSQDRALKTVTDLWREYEVGLRGMPSVQEMDEQWGSAWRREEKDRKHYERRMRIILRVKELAAEKKVSVSVAVGLLEYARMQLHNKSLSKLSEMIHSNDPLQLPDLSLNHIA